MPHVTVLAELLQELPVPQMSVFGQGWSGGSGEILFLHRRTSRRKGREAGRHQQILPAIIIWIAVSRGLLPGSRFAWRKASKAPPQTDQM
jgi:hypothetical protein